MKGDLFINDIDAWDAWGVNMGEGFLDSLDSFVPLKDFIYNESRLEHGKRIVITDPKLDSRELTLQFTIKGNSVLDFEQKKSSFKDQLQKGILKIRVPALGESVYNLVYTGKNISYALSLSRTFCKFSCKFEEPNPFIRE